MSDKPYGYVWISIKDGMETRFTRMYPNEFYKPFDIVPVYTTPQTKPLSDEEIETEYKKLFAMKTVDKWSYKFARAIEKRILGK